MTITVIIPALNEAGAIARTIESAAGAEIIVADGGSGDDTVAIARRLGAQAVEETGGRGAQQNAGAAMAGPGNPLLFLHADTLLPSGWMQDVEQLLSRTDTALGAFSLRIADARPAEKVIAAGASLRSRCFGLPYGDQALFLRRDAFDRLGGFRPLPIMEDYDLVRRARTLGRVVTLQALVETSPRRWRSKGALRSVAINQAMLAGWHLGLSPERLARLYRGLARR
ncbi:hypothetical protein B5C34_06215 [Pacificimonas flava]|uniref:Glycosyltransferase 2-like domain-containing protein n=2 Tax=Pacificimonas TaxID=1960290 RepID=A0A219B5P5_9SPHN|nr:MULTISPECIES: TIGR04283 family arsenosugar biosynthesis glycosyltransferase [Pacificimonas]MBZ6377180.1 TIGR04283 family arsenosugar biosynthesis glycosyltransferase [Pacificimonas aurantium]OWV33098.1 hypothetical protein B5C34_06215 [Pacificimonas flava]